MRRLDDPSSLGEFFLREETGAPVSHRNQRFSIDGSFEVEPEQKSFVLTEELIDVDVVDDGISRSGKVIMEDHLCIEQSIDGEPLSVKIGTEKSAQEQVCLATFDGDRCRNSTGVQIPAVWLNIMSRDDASRSKGEGLPFQFEDPIDQHQWLVG